MEEDYDLRSGAEFADELRKHDGYHAPDFVEEDADTVDCGDGSSAECRGEFGLSTRLRRHKEVRWLEAVFSFSSPLLFFPEAPEHED